MHFFFTSSVSAPAEGADSVNSAEDDWHQALAQAVRDPDELIELLELPQALREPARQSARLFPLLVPRSFLARMRHGDMHDPLLAQVLPLGIEESPAPGFGFDPVG